MAINIRCRDNFIAAMRFVCPEIVDYSRSEYDKGRASLDGESDNLFLVLDIFEDEVQGMEDDLNYPMFCMSDGYNRIRVRVSGEVEYSLAHAMTNADMCVRAFEIGMHTQGMITGMVEMDFQYRLRHHSQGIAPETREWMQRCVAEYCSPWDLVHGRD